MDVRVTLSADQKPELMALLRNLPAILSGRVPDAYGIAAGFRARIGFTLLSLIAANFNELGRGQAGADGTKWPPLTRAYLAYGRRFGKGEQKQLMRDAGLRRLGEGSRPTLTPDQDKLWRQIYSFHLRRLFMRMGDEEAKRAAAAIAWNKLKALGAKTKLEVFGNRQVQMLVDTGRLRGSLQPGTIIEHNAQADYNKPSGIGGPEQLFDVDQPELVAVGTTVRYAIYHHAAKNPRRKRRLWPEQLPDNWWKQILGSAVSGLSRIAESFKIGA